MRLLRILPLCIAALVKTIMFAETCKAQSAQFGNHPKYEVRAVWLTTLGGLDWPKNKAVNTSSSEKQKQELTLVLDKLKAAGINTVLFQTRIRATVIYPSAIEPWDACLTGMSKQSPGYDPLAFAIDECHKRGMEIQAWIVVMPVGKWNSAGCIALRRKHPKLVTKNGDEGYIDPARPEAATYIASICKEIANRYDIDGIHLDYIRYPETWPDRKKNIQKQKRRKHRINGLTSVKNGTDNAELKLQQDNITAIVRAVHDGIKQIKPWVKLSCATIGKSSDLARFSSKGWNALSKGCQDTQKWINANLVDQLYPMMYFRGNNFYPFVFDWKENSHGLTIVPGTGIYFLSQQEGNWPAEEIKRQLNVARGAGMGFAFFRERFLRDDTKGIYNYTKNIFAPYPALIPSMGKSDTAKASAPKNLNVRPYGGYDILSWDSEPTAGATTFNVYASTRWPVDTADARNIIAARTLSTRIALKPGNRKLYYAVTGVNRYGTESTPTQQPKTDTKPRTSYLIYNDGQHLTLADTNKKPYNGYILIKDIAEREVNVMPCVGGQTDISGVAEGFYSIYTLNSKGTAHRIGFTEIRRNNIWH